MSTTADDESIAVVGISARFPGARDATQLWSLLRQGLDAIREVPRSRFDIDRLYEEAPGTPGRLSSRWGGFLDDIDRFDAAFFGISPREASRMDPQQRLALEAAWDALDDGGQAPLRLRGAPAGVFLGVHRDEYSGLLEQDAAEIDLLSATGGSRSGVAARISYALGLEGPSLVFDTDRSSSLVAVHAACQSLRGGECSLALAGGVNLILSPALSLGFSRANMLAPDGRIKFCDARADGIVRSDGVGMVVLKRARDAQRDGDRIYALILGSAINHDGRRSGDLMTPSRASQAALLRAACRSAGVAPHDIQYVEAHGTGTVVGDPVEVEALAEVLQRGRAAGEALRIGSIKTNLGHTEAAAGIAGLIKVALAMRHRVLPASLHFQTPNPRIAFDGIVVQQQATPWPDEERRLLAGVTSLGLTGVNAHAILAEAPRRAEAARAADDPAPELAAEVGPDPAPAEAELLTVSARGRAALAAAARRYVEHLRGDGGASVSEIARAAATRRSHLEDRLAVVGGSREELARELEAWLETGDAGVRFAQRPRIAFVFPGHGSQWVGMGRELLAQGGAFRASMLRCDAVVREVAGWSLCEELAKDGAASRLNEFGIVQPSLVALEISLAAQWRAWGIEPGLIVGTSMGEVAAAQVAGALSLEDAMLVICRRARLVQERVAGAAAIVELAVAEARELLAGRGGRAWIAGRNGPSATLLAGDAAAMEEILSEVRGRGRGAWYVKGLPATHTPLAEPIAAELGRALERVAPMRARVPMISTVTAERVDGPELDGAYWVRNLLEPFELPAVIEQLLDTGCEVFLEVSPHPVVQAPIQDLVAHGGRQALVLGSLRRSQPERRALLGALGALYACGLDLDWERLFTRGGGDFVELPGYAWQRQRYWIGGEAPAAAANDRGADAVARTPDAAVRALDAATRQPDAADQQPDAADGADRQPDAAAPSGAAIRWLDPLEGATHRERLERARRLVTRELAKVLGIGDADTLETRRSFRELGVTSLMGMELVTRLGRAALDRALPSSVLFNHPDVEALAEYLLSERERRAGAPIVAPAPVAGARPSLGEPIAIVGMGCRLPGGADDPDAFWRLLDTGADAIREVPPNRWDLERWYAPEPGQPGKMRTRWGGFLDDIDQFDADFFGISPREAEEMDPQQRLLLEVAWDALERAGLAPDRLLGGKAGVFLGVMNNNDYAARKRLLDDPARIRAHHSTGMATSIAAGRVAYLLGLTGPTLAIDTACSSSLVAVHLAMQSLRHGECDLALAGGVNAILSPELTVAFSQAGMLSPAGRCKTFDASADGYVRSEGCGVLVLRRLSDAIAAGDNVLAVLRGSAVNHDGRSNGLTAPNGHAQRALVQHALADAGLSPADVDYVEAHGTGTRLGDPIEFGALGEVFQATRSSERPVLVGSVKTNIGHLEAAAGVAGLIKVVLALRHRSIPPHLHLEAKNPLLSAEPYPLEIPTRRTPWPGDGRRVAGVSSFGFSGTNAHVVVAEAPDAAATAPARPAPRSAELVVLSARSERALLALAGKHAAYLQEHAELPLGEVAFTLAAGRTHHDHRLAIVAGTRAALIGALEAAARGQRPAPSGKPRGKLAWLFTGQGAQRPGMGRGLAAEWPVFARALDDACAALDPHLPRPLRDVMWAGEDAAARALLDQTGFTQPAMFAIEVALAALWRSWGVQPDLVTGHSVGELAAAHVAGVLSLEDAARLVAARARLMQALPPGGAMFAIAAREEEVAAAVAPHGRAVAIAAVNGPAAVVIAGDEEAAAEIAASFARRGARTSRLAVSHAFHSPRMEPMLDDFRAVAERVRYRQPEVPGAGNVDGALWGPEVATADYWVRHVRAPVRFADGVRALHAAGARTFVELGPRPALAALVPACVPDGDELTVLAAMRAERAEPEVVLEALAGWYTTGGAVEWSGVFPGQRRRVELPTYAWQRQRYWISPSASPSPADRREGRAAGLLGTRIAVASGDVIYDTELSVERQPWLADHRVGDEVVVPAAAMLELLEAAARDRFEELRSIAVSAPLRLAAGEARQVQVVVTGGADDRARVALYSRTSEAAPWTVHAEAEPHRGGLAAEAHQARLDLPALRARCAERVDVEATYAALAEVGLAYGPAFRGLRELWRGPGEALARVAVPEGWGAEELGVHPALLDAALQVTVAGAGDLYLPFACERMRVRARGATEAWVSVRYTTPPGQATLGAEIALVDARGEAIASLSGFRARRADLQALGRGRAAAGAMFRLAWQPVEAAPAPPRPGRWVVAGEGELAAQVAAQLAARGARCTRVGWTELAGALPAEQIVCIWDGGASPPPPAAALQLACEGLEVVKALAPQAAAPRVWWMTRGAVSVEPRELPRLAAPALWGLGRTWRIEHPELGCSLVDLPAGEGAVAAAMAELAIDDDEREVAWRARRRYGVRLQAAADAGAAPRALRDSQDDSRGAPGGQHPPGVRTDGTVLVTGGLGGIGRHVARWLAQRGVRHLLLTGRRGDRTPGAAELADELRGLGAAVTVAALDVTDRAALAAALDGIPRELPLRAVVHAAGTLDDGVLADQTAARLAGVMAPKAEGAWHLDELTRGADLDAFVLFSSVAGALGSAGQAPYAAANAFLDGLAAHRRARGLPAVSLSWGPWAGTGMTEALDAAQRQRWVARGLEPLAPSRGLALLEAALERQDAQLVLAPLDLAQVGRAFAGAVPPMWRALVQAPPPVAASRTWADELRAMPAAQRAEAALALVRAEVARLLALAGPEAVGVDRPLKALGLDSLMALELRNALGRRAGASLPATLAFDYPTAAALARYLVEHVLGTGPEDVPAATPAAAPSTPSAPIAPDAAPIAPDAAPDEPGAPDEPIAIVGFGCRFPGGVTDPASFWRLLADGVDAIGEVPRDRWDVDAYYDPDPGAPGKMYTREGGFLAGLDQFEPEFFEISPREAVSMDPQQRLLLETSWEALERAGIAPGSLADANVGVFVGVMSHEYLELQGPDLERRDGYVTTGSLGSVASGRISYALGVRGPSMTIDTACSSSLVATHLACQSLRAGECDLALAGGATVVLTPSLYVEFSRLRGLSRDGRCKSFAAAADGVSWSEGCGVIALKRLRDARRDGDRVLAVIAGSAVNQDGRSQGLTAPNGLAQQDVIRRALAQAKLAPAALDYVEAHGTGTRLGDPIEMQALGAVLRQGRDPQRPVIVGSLKSNVGHSQAAAGVGGIIKTVLALEHERIPRSLHFDEPSPHIPWSELPVQVASEAVPWKRRPDRPRTAGISSFGISGTNAHVVVQEAPPEPAPAPARTPAPSPAAELLVISARSEAALREAAAQLGAHLRDHAELDLGDVAATLARGRTHHPHRLAVVASSRAQASQLLEAAAQDSPLPPGAHRDVAHDSRERLAWLFTGQGSQAAGMGRGLATAWPAFRRELDRVCDALDAHLDRPLRSVLWDDDAGLLDQTQYTQPALFALEVALAALWRSWGISPDVLIGHSVGELAAAHVAGVLGLDDATRLVAARARLMQALPAGGAMVSIEAPEAVVAEAVAPHADRVSIAAVNGPASVVISGASAAVEAIAEGFADRGVRTRRLVVSHAFHSPLMEPMLDDFRRVAESIEYRAPSVALISNLSGALAGDEVRTAAYWVEHVRRAVRFADGVRAAHEAGARVFLELGPRPTLLGLVPASWPARDAGPLLLASLRADRGEPEAALEALGRLHARGARIDWDGVFAGDRPGGRPGRQRRVDLPTYPWQRKSYWVSPRRGATDALAPGMTAIAHPLLQATLPRPDSEEHLFTARLSLRELPWLADHRVYGTAVLPGAAFVELALAVGQELGLRALVDLTLAAPLPLPEAGAVPVQIWVQAPDAEGRRGFALYGRAADGAWICHARGQLARRSAAPASPEAWPDAWPPRQATAIDLSGAYDRLAADGLAYGPAFRGLQALWRDGLDPYVLYAEVELPAPARPDADQRAAHLLHPALLDAALHALPLVSPAPEGVLLPFEWRDVELGAAGATRLLVRLQIEAHGDELSKVVLAARDAAGARVLRVGELVLRRARAEGMRAAAAPRDARLYQVGWEPLPASSGEPARAIVVGGSGALAQRLGLPRAGDLGALSEEPPPLVIVDATTGAGPDLTAQAHASAHQALALLQAWLLEDHLAESELVWVTQGAIAAAETDALEGLGQAPIWGLVRAARRESPHRQLRLLDVEADSSRAQILAALAVRGEPELAVRGSAIRAARLEVAPPAPAAQPWRTDGTVLVTGATGTLGAQIARHLVARHGVRHLLLVSRQGAEAPGARALADELAQLGAQVTVAACDVSRRAPLEALLQGVTPPLRAVFHCAGATADAALRGQSPERVDRVFGPKVDAAVHLHELTRSLALDAFVLFSSLSGIVGTAGQANYAAANAFLDALAVHRSRAGLAGQSLAWGLWEPSETPAGAGMAEKLTPADLARLRRQGIVALSAPQGLALLDEALARGEPLLAPARLELSAIDPAAPAEILRALAVAAAPPRPAATRPGTEDAAALRQRLAQLAPDEQRSALLELVRTAAGEVFRLPAHAIPDDQPLKSLGLDSLIAVELRDRLQAKLHATLPATLVFDHPTAGDIARFVATLLPSGGAAPAAPADEEARVRRALATLPLDVLRQHGLLAWLLQLAGGEAAAPAAPAAPAAAIHELSNEELVSLMKSL